MAGRRGTVSAVGWAVVVLLALSHTAAQDGSKTTAGPPLVENGTNKVINTDTHQASENIQHIRVKVLVEEPFVIRTKDASRFAGMFIDILENITRSASVNKSFTILPMGDNMYGYEHSPGNWTGLMGALQRGEADLAVAPLSMVSKRHDVVDFTLPIMSAGLRILYKAPNPWTDNAAFTILLSPFSAGMWVVALLMFIAVSVFLYLIGRFSPYEDHAFVGKAATYEGLTSVNSLLYTFTSMTFQGYTAAPRSASGRVLAGFWWLFVLMLLAAYSAGLCAVFLAFRPSTTGVPFTTFDELSQQTHVSYGILEGGTTQWYLSRSKRPLERRLWGTISANREKVMVKSTREGVHRVQASNGEYAFILEGPMVEYISGHPPCDLMMLGEELNQHSYGFACRKGTNLCSSLNQAILELQESDGIYDFKKKWFHHGCEGKGPSEYIYQGLAYFDTFGGTPKYYADRAVTLRRFGVGFLLILLGLAVSTCVLLAEIFYAKKRGSPVPQRMAQGMDDQEPIDKEYTDDTS